MKLNLDRLQTAGYAVIILDAEGRDTHETGAPPSDIIIHGDTPLDPRAYSGLEKFLRAHYPRITESEREQAVVALTGKAEAFDIIRLLD
jgi:hypothetical protein